MGVDHVGGLGAVHGAAAADAGHNVGLEGAHLLHAVHNHGIGGVGADAVEEHDLKAHGLHVVKSLGDEGKGGYKAIGENRDTRSAESLYFLAHGGEGAFARHYLAWPATVGFYHCAYLLYFGFHGLSISRGIVNSKTI